MPLTSFLQLQRSSHLVRVHFLLTSNFLCASHGPTLRASLWEVHSFWPAGAISTAVWWELAGGPNSREDELEIKTALPPRKLSTSLHLLHVGSGCCPDISRHREISPLSPDTWDTQQHGLIWCDENRTPPLWSPPPVTGKMSLQCQQSLQNNWSGHLRMVRNIKVKLGFEKLPQARQACSESRIPWRFPGWDLKTGKRYQLKT